MLLEELKTDEHKPMKFLCEGGNYFLKYRIHVSQKEMDCLAYEVLCHFLLLALDIPTPDIALATVVEGSFDPKLMPANRKRVKSGTICFASKEVEPATIITGIQAIESKRDFKQLLNAEDLIRIGLFDLWVANVDRAKEDNYNLLLRGTPEGNELLAFDHGFAFGGQAHLRWLRLDQSLFFDSSRLLRSHYTKQVLKHISIQDRIAVLENWIPLLYENEVLEAIHHAFKIIPAAWQIWPDLEKKVIQILSDRERILKIKAEALTLLTL